jgi:hypothetical protein
MNRKITGKTKRPNVKGCPSPAIIGYGEVQPFAWSAAGSAAHKALLGICFRKEITEYAP